MNFDDQDGIILDIDDEKAIAKAFEEWLIENGIEPEKTTAKSFNEIVKSEEASTTGKALSFSEITKFNPYHDRLGRFTSGGGGAASFSANPNTNAGRKAIERAGKDNPLIGAAYGQGKTVRQEAAENADLIRGAVSNKVNPIKAKPLDVDKVMAEAGCDRATATRAGELSKEIFAKASKDCPKITDDVIAATRKNGGNMYGLDARQKMETSMARKIATDARVDKVSLEKAAAGVKDSVRFTAVFETKDFKSGYENVKSTLLEQGYKHVRSKDFFKSYDEGKSCIKSVQDVFESPNGVKFEFQFQTPETQGAKEVTHPLYERARSASTSKHEAARLNDIMRDTFADVPNY